MGSRGGGFPAWFSLDRRYRYTLWRYCIPLDHCFDGRVVMFIGLNPSTADEINDDPTVRRCIDFTKRWGFPAMVMTNIFAFRATDPAVMKREPEPVGADNDRALIEQAHAAKLVVAAWGVHGEHNSRGATVRAMLEARGVKLHHLGLTKLGHPKHPLYLRSDLRPQPWVA